MQRLEKISTTSEKFGSAGGKATAARSALSSLMPLKTQ